MDHSHSELSYNDSLHEALGLFAKYDVQRIIPSVVAGFKPGQRMVAKSIILKFSKLVEESTEIDDLMPSRSGPRSSAIG